MISRCSIHPFDICSDNFEQTIEKIKQYGFYEIELSEAEQKIIDFKVLCFSLPNSDISLRIVEQGFGVFITNKKYPYAQLKKHEDIASILIDRKQHHVNVMNGNSTICALANKLFPKIYFTQRPDIFKGFPYVLSYFVIANDEIEISQDNIIQNNSELKSIYALYEPSRISLAESDNENQESISTVASRIGLLDENECHEYLNDHDIKPESQFFASWAGAVHLVPKNIFDDEILMMNALETRIQLGWIISHYIQKWSHSIIKKKSSLRSLESAKWKIMPLLKSAKALTDASISTRVSNILNILKSTSGLNTQISDAELAFGDMEEYLEYKHKVRTRKYETFIEVILFILATTQIVPLFWSTPLVELSQGWLSIVGVLLVFVTYLIIRRF